MIGVLMMAYGGPNNLDEVEPYLMDVRGHRPTSAKIVAEVRARYNEIGGRSPILEQTRAQAEALEAALNAEVPGKFKVFVGMRHWHPYIKDTLAEMTAAGITSVIGLVMAPHFSQLSIAAYYKRVEEAGFAIDLIRIEDWHLLPAYIDALAGRVRAALEKFPANARSETQIIFTAHSLPQRILTTGDPYPYQLIETMNAIMQKLGPRSHEFAYQSAAISAEPWLGPDAGEVIKRLAGEDKKHILIVPIGFVCEHVEILYGVDIVFQLEAAALGVQLERIEMLGTDSRMIAGLAQLIREKVQLAGWL